jgi:hypothetical protein
MLWISFVVVAIFIWLVFTNPFKDLVMRDTYENYIKEMKEKEQRKES